MQEQLVQLQLRSQQGETKKTYAFWETQPVAQFTEDASTLQSLEVIKDRSCSYHDSDEHMDMRPFKGAKQT